MGSPSINSAVTAASEPADVLGFVLFEDDLPQLEDPAFAAMDRAMRGFLRHSLLDGRFRAKPGQSVMAPPTPALPARRIAVVGAGPRGRFVPADAQHLGARLAR